MTGPRTTTTSLVDDQGRIVHRRTAASPHRRIARGFRNRDNYRLRMLLIAGGLNL